jgi:hypothetical protein
MAAAGLEVRSRVGGATLEPMVSVPPLAECPPLPAAAEPEPDEEDDEQPATRARQATAGQARPIMDRLTICISRPTISHKTSRL